VVNAEYAVILLPKFDTSQMVKRRGRRLNKKTTRGLLTWGHFKFRQRLLQMAELLRRCTVVICDESYTSTTCDAYGNIHKNMSGNKTFLCPNPSCSYVAGRDANGARYVLIGTTSII